MRQQDMMPADSFRRFTVSIDVLGDALIDAPELELADMLRKLADRVEKGLSEADVLPVLDTNGNRYGTAQIEWV